MTRLATTIFALTLLGAPVAAQTMTVLLPAISFPADTLTTSTRGCKPARAVNVACHIGE